MITGRGQLKIGGVAMELSFTVTAGLCPPQALLVDAQRLADGITDHAAAKVEQADHRISCQKGCGACCRQMVPVTPVEARHLTAVVEAMPPERQAVVRARFKAARETLNAAQLGDPGHPEEDKPAYRAYGVGYFHMRVPCPFLEEESCSIHADRPLVCREYLVTSPPAACAALGTGQVRQVVMPLHVWALFGRSMAGDGGLDWMPLIHSLDYGPAPGPAVCAHRSAAGGGFVESLAALVGNPGTGCGRLAIPPPPRGGITLDQTRGW